MSSIYRKGEVLGWGSVAVVHRGWDELLDRPVAIKELKQPFAGSEPFARVFRAQALKMLDIPSRYVLSTYTVDTDRNVQAVVRELADETMGQRSFRGPMEPESVIPMLRQILAGLDALHARGIIHGAVKPENIFICGKDYRIGDFGVPAVEGAPPIPLSRLRHASPEEVLDPGRVDRSSDIYSLGVATYELILGALRLEQVIDEIVRDAGLVAEPKSRKGDELWQLFHGSGIDLPPLHELDPGVPAALSLTLQKMVCKDLSSRFANCKKVLASLGSAATAELPTGSQRLSIALNVPSPASAAPPNSPAGATPNWVWALGGALTVSVMVAAGAWTFRTHDSGPATAPAPRAASQEPVPGTGETTTAPEAAKPEGDLADRLLGLRSPEGGPAITLEPAVAGSRPRLAVGTPLRFRLESERGGYLLFFALSPDGSITCLYPNGKRLSPTLTPGRPALLPSTEDELPLEAQAPLGRELVFALVSDRHLPSLPAGAGEILFEYPEGEKARIFADWVERLRRENPSTRMAALDFEIGAAR